MVPEITVEFSIPLTSISKQPMMKKFTEDDHVQNSQQFSAIPGLPLFHGFSLFPREIAVLQEFISKGNAVVTRILQEVSQFVILSVTQRRKINLT